MPLVAGYALSHSPVLYRPRYLWPALRSALTGAVPQPAAARAETDELLQRYELRIEAAFDALTTSIRSASIETLVVLVADRSRYFDETHTPQIHVFAGREIWGDAAVYEAGEQPAIATLPVDTELAALLAEELAFAGFDVAESRSEFVPSGASERGAVASLIEPIVTLRAIVPVLRIVPIHINAHTAPRLTGRRAVALGSALARALALSPRRSAILASGGMSGDAGGYLAGWIDEPLDRWVLNRLITQRSSELTSLFDVESLTLRGSTRELRLWAAAGAAMEGAGARARVIDYLPFHHAAVGTAFVHWQV